ncbi:MAG: 2-polyprenyl-3-methyl-6-methoxy-1,4-benzoquinone monooxygenase [Rhodocyclaceae bacterium]
MSIDRLIIGFDKALRTVFSAAPTLREQPGRNLPEAVLSADEKALAGALMRVNHAGEVCAQALYQGQALSCRDSRIRRSLEKAAGEETDHLAWTERRIGELGAHKSLLNALWYCGSLSMGVLAGKLGDGWNLGFLAETERQVEAHLDRHLERLPTHDMKSRAVLQQMRLDEISHAETAMALGARDLPFPIKTAMRLVSGVMTRTAYYL